MFTSAISPTIEPALTVVTYSPLIDIGAAFDNDIALVAESALVNDQRPGGKLFSFTERGNFLKLSLAEIAKEADSSKPVCVEFVVTSEHVAPRFQPRWAG
ncbi:MAG: hypothetical protein R2706_00045 [Acidimicrobiales bacterium]